MAHPPTKQRCRVGLRGCPELREEVLPCARPYQDAHSHLLQFQSHLANFNSPAFHAVIPLQAFAWSLLSRGLQFSGQGLASCAQPCLMPSGLVMRLFSLLRCTPTWPLCHLSLSRRTVWLSVFSGRSVSGFWRVRLPFSSLYHTGKCRTWHRGDGRRVSLAE